jgi:hypothetical protein
MNKRGDVETSMLMEWGKTVLYVILFLLLLAIFYGVYSLFFKEKTTPEQLDMERVLRELTTLPEGRSLNVITSSSGYQLSLYGPGNSEPSCATKPCLCLMQEGKPPKCEVVKDLVDCSRGICIEESEMPQVFPSGGLLQKGTPVPICRKDNMLKLGTC